MENFSSLLGRSIGNLKSKLDVRQYALEVALGLPEEDKLGKAKEIEEYLTDGVDIPLYSDPNSSYLDMLKMLQKTMEKSPKNEEKEEEKAETKEENKQYT